MEKGYSLFVTFMFTNNVKQEGIYVIYVFQWKPRINAKSKLMMIIIKPYDPYARFFTAYHRAGRIVQSPFDLAVI